MASCLTLASDHSRCQQSSTVISP